MADRTEVKPLPALIADYAAARKRGMEALSLIYKGEAHYHIPVKETDADVVIASAFQAADAVVEAAQKRETFLRTLIEAAIKDVQPYVASKGDSVYQYASGMIDAYGIVLSSLGNPVPTQDHKLVAAVDDLISAVDHLNVTPIRTVGDYLSLDSAIEQVRAARREEMP